MKRNKKQYQNIIRRAGAQSAVHAKRTVDNTNMWEWQQCLLPTVLINWALKQTENSLRLSAGLGTGIHTPLHKHTLSHRYSLLLPGKQSGN